MSPGLPTTTPGAKQSLKGLGVYLFYLVINSAPDSLSLLIFLIFTLEMRDQYIFLEIIPVECEINKLVVFNNTWLFFN